MKKWYKECPFCANEIKEKAIKCQYCWEFLPKEEKTISKKEVKKEKKEGPFCDEELVDKISEKNEIQDTLNIKKDFIQKFFEKNNSVRISKLGEYLFCNKNRISWQQAFAWWLKLWFLCWLLILLRKIVSICLWISEMKVWQWYAILSWIRFAIIIIFYLIVYIKQNISRLHDIWQSGWWFLLTINPTFFIILLCIPWNKCRNIYWESNIIEHKEFTAEEKKEQDKKLSLIWKILLTIIILSFSLLALIIVTTILR